MSSRTYMGSFLYEEWDDGTRTYRRWDPDTGDLVEERSFTEDENAEADTTFEAESRLTDLEARIATLEAKIFAVDQSTVPEPGDPSVPTWSELVPPNWWYNETLLNDNGAVYRNVSGTVLTTPPSMFPGGPSHWTHLFVVVSGGTEEPSDPTDPPAEEYPAWSANASYEIGDKVTHNGHIWECKIAHGAEYQGTWAPGPATPTVWTDLGPA